MRAVPSALSFLVLNPRAKPYSPYGIRMAVEETAQIQGHLDSFSQGHGLIQVNKAFENLQSTSESRSNVGFEIQNTNQSSERGIYLRENTPSITTHKLRIQPLFTKATKAHTKAIFENWAVLTCEASWVSSPDSVLINQKGGQGGRDGQLYNAYPGARIQLSSRAKINSAEGLFSKIPVHAIVPSSLAGIDKTEWKKKLQLQPGEVQRVFLKPPSWAKWAEMRVQSNSSESNDRLVLTYRPALAIPTLQPRRVEKIHSSKVTQQLSSIGSRPWQSNDGMDVCILLVQPIAHKTKC